jgi:hypothetical protein
MKLLSFMVAAMAIASAQPTPPDLKGWTSTTWGMTEDEILAALPGQAVHLTGPAGARTYANRTAAIGIESLVIGKDDFHVDFLMDREGKLDRVMIGLNTRSPSVLTFEGLEALLTEKYGTATITDKTQEQGLKRTCKWIFPSTVIQLLFWDVRALKMHIFSLVYEKNTGKDLVKL